MKLLISLIILIILSGKLYSQYHTIDIPEMKNLNAEDKYPERSILATYVTNFDMLISLKSYSAWMSDENIKVLAHHSAGWYKIEINTDHKSFGTFDAVCYLLFKLNDSIGNAIWKILTENHLFDMADDRSEKLRNCGLISSDTVIQKGRKQVTYNFCDVSDGDEHEFEIITADRYKKLYFYTPLDKYRCCPELQERLWIVNCIRVFEKYLGN